MAKRVNDALLDSKAARARLKPRGKPYYRSIGGGLHIGYRRAKTGEGRWVVRYPHNDPDKDYVVETVATADDKLDANGETVLDWNQAQEKARAIYNARMTGEDKASLSLTVKDAIDDYLAWMETHRKSAKDSRWRAEALIIPELGKKIVAKLTAKEIENWRDKIAKTQPRLRTKKGEAQQFRKIADDPDEIRRRKSSANRVLTILKAALNRAAKEGVWGRVKPFKGADAARVRYLTVAEARRLTNASDPAFRPMVQAALQTGARYGELAALKVEDFNPDAGTVHVRQSKAGKGRHIVLTDEGVTFFKGATAGRMGAEALFAGDGGGVWGKSHQSRPMAEACRAAKISPAISFHGLRHTWASLAIMNGVPLMVVASNLGHSDTRMVEKHYGHLADSFIRDAIRANAPRFGGEEATNVIPLESAAG
jgi:integrase